jgi:FMN phosphatase YigB (HAD superfamily)
MYTAILFDLDGTLIDFDACVRDALRAAFAELGYEVSDEQMWAEIQAASTEAGDLYWGQKPALGWTRAQVMEAVMRDTLAALGAETEHPEVPAHVYWARFCQGSHLNPGAIEALERLQGRFKLGLVTNEAGCAKPDPRLFALALNELGVDAKEALYVGDSIEHDYTGAQQAGIDFCYYQPDPEAHPEVRPALRVRSLVELADWLAQ